MQKKTVRGIEKQERHETHRKQSKIAAINPSTGSSRSNAVRVTGV